MDVVNNEKQIYLSRNADYMKMKNRYDQLLEELEILKISMKAIEDTIKVNIVYP